eukprot:m.307211 g.307211  ORF g.307211 m.307211 type:complete len:416 (+) comp42024_c0_seq1:46-1293(+)
MFSRLLSALIVTLQVISATRYRISPKQVGEPSYVWTKDGDGDTALYRIPLITPAPNGTLVALTEARKTASSDAGYKFLASKNILEPMPANVSSASGKVLPANVKLSSTMIVEDNGYTQPDGVILGAVVTVTPDEQHKSMQPAVLVVYSECQHSCPSAPTFVVRSFDNGASWENPPLEITDQIGGPHVTFAPGPGTGLQKRHSPHIGRLVVCGHYHNIYEDQDYMDTEGLKCIYSDNYGQTWKNGAIIPGMPFNQTKIGGDFLPNENQPVELPDGSILISIRNQYGYHAKARMFGRSYDGGETIGLESIYVAKNLTDPACAAGMVYVPKYGVLLHSNLVNTEARTNLALSWSYDWGKTWNLEDRIMIWPEGAGYSCMTAIPGYEDRYVGVLYEQGESSSDGYIVLTRFDLNPQAID